MEREAAFFKYFHRLLGCCHVVLMDTYHDTGKLLKNNSKRRAWGSGNPGTRQPAGGLGRATAGGGYLPRSAGMRTRGDPAELPRPLAVGYGGITSGDFLSAGQTNRNQNKRLLNKGKQNEVNGHRLLFRV